MTKDIRISLPVLHPAQRQIANSEARFKVICCGRRFGKTLLAIDDVVNTLLDGQSYGYFAPTYGDLEKLCWKPLKKILEPITSYKHETYKIIETVTGGTFAGFTMEVERPGQGHHFHKVAVDEAGTIPKLKSKFEESIRPTLLDYIGDATFYSTPRGHNDFWQLYNQGLDPLQDDWQAFHFTSFDNPYMDKQELETIRNSTPLRTWQEEYLAQFKTDGGQVFRDVDRIATLPPVEPYEGEFVFGVDWGRVNDFTAISVMDVNTHKQVCIDRFNQIGWQAQRNRLMTLYLKWKPFRILAEQNSIGEVNIEALAQEAWQEGYDDFLIDGFITTAVSKPPLIDDLTTAIERQEIQLQDDTQQLNEFTSYGLKRLLSGRFQYGAPSGGLDDTVIATALSFRAMGESVRSILLDMGN